MQIIKNTPTISTDIYAAGDAVTAKITDFYVPFEEGYIVAATIFDSDQEEANITIHICDDDFTGVAANAALAVTAGDETKFRINIPITSYTTIGSEVSVGRPAEDKLWIPFKAYRALDFDNTRNAWYLPMILSTSGTPTYTATDDLTIGLVIVDIFGY